LGALSDVVLPFVLLGSPEFGARAALPLSEFVMPGVPYPPVAPFTWLVGLAVLPEEPAPLEPPAACA
jgi:hypothetical protein